MKIIQRIFQYLDYKGINKAELERICGVSNGYFAKMRARNANIGEDIILKVIENCPEISRSWLIFGEGEMLRKPDNSPEIKEKNKIPLYNVDSIGGNNGLVADANSPTDRPSEWIDAGDWFSEATSAIHHYGDSMVEYPAGCILALREIYDMKLIIWGKNYVIETEEYRITKRLQRCNNPDVVVAYSTNEEKYEDGTLIHQPLEIPKHEIRRLALVLGYVVKEQSSGKLYNIKNKKI